MKSLPMPQTSLVRTLLLGSLLLCLAVQSALAQAQAQAQASPASTEPAQAEAPASDEGVVNVNTATEEELMRLPGVGPAKASAILALRERIKKFPRLSALMRVKGIGRKTFAKLRPMLILEGPTTLQRGQARGQARAKQAASTTDEE